MADTTPLPRARIACKACNARRVKCDAAIERPCWHCRMRGTPCELIESRRGRYTTNFSNLTYTIEVDAAPEHGSTHPSKVQYPIPPSIAQTLSHTPQTEAPVSLPVALILPPLPVAEKLIRAFFELIHPAFPVIDRHEFSHLYTQGQASPLLLQAIFLLGFTVGDESLIHAAGYSDRAALYDADYETCRDTIVAALLLLGFYWSGPEDQKDTCYWIGCATNAAQALGMHRSISQSGTPQSVRCLRKRIWWSVYTRDRHTAAAFGQPCRIRDEDCDIEPPTQEDLEFDNDYDHSLIPKQEDFHVLYFMEMSKLASVRESHVYGPQFLPLGPVS
ncbi:hypothetical protein BO99DRAFT_427302 [Aspergillus violaceofuscus CBS 115571]|uniref:Zn(2)-C6 fungal-type domain-containing protein n=1 Tax=Aspergillus violaceofuscus (strain CBS 115571) TaxID=1450538 RepID=A0A2V5I0A3_ASPV1|nr:hypothetical protein BO99DRAFT_427302 [Aspergillus violaceofuscus CBS 115571]